MLTFDLETTNHSYGSALDARNRVVMVSWRSDDGPNRHHWGDLMTAHEFWAAMDAEQVVCAYNKKFEQLWLLRYGVDIDRWIWHDPMLAERVLRGNERVPMGLGAVSPRYGFSAKDPVIDKMMAAGICPSEMPRNRLTARCVRDVNTTHAILKQQLRQLTAAEQLHLYRQRCDFGNILARMEHNGMFLDRVAVEAAYAEACRELADVEGELSVLTGGINLRSSDQLAEFLYGTLGFPERTDARGKPVRNKPSKRWPDGKPKTDQHTLKWLESVATTEAQTHFIHLRRQYGKVNARLTKNLEFFVGVCREYGGKFHGRFNQTVAATHRLTASGLPLPIAFLGDKERSVQFQNMPRDMKKLFKAPPGYVVVEADMPQLEFRVAVYLGDDPQGRADIADPNFDAHCVSASVMQGMDYAEFKCLYDSGDGWAKAARTAAKPETFKPLYGGERGTPEQERWYAGFRQRYHKIWDTQENWLADVAANDGWLIMPWGMRFRWKAHYNRRGVLLDNVTKRPIKPQVYNYPVQNLATAEIVPIAVISLYRACKEAKIDVQFVNTIHDSVICYVRENHVAKFEQLAKRAFTDDVYEYLSLHYGMDFNMPLGCGLTVGLHWGVGDEIKYDDAKRGGKDGKD